MVDLDNLHVIFAEDEEMFRDIARPAVLKAGVKESNLHEAGCGGEAVEHFRRLLAGDSATGLLFVVILDFCMPDMNGSNCAQKLQEAQISGMRCPPFYVMLSSAVREVLRGAEAGDVFDMQVPKPLSSKTMALVMARATEVWGAAASGGAPGSRGGAGEGGAGTAGGAARWGVEDVEVVVADDEMICRMVHVAALSSLGLRILTEVEDLEEATEALQSAQRGDAGKPLLVLLGNTAWARPIGAARLDARRPFVVCTAGDGGCSASDRDALAGILSGHPAQGTLKKLLTLVCEMWGQPERAKGILSI